MSLVDHARTELELLGEESETIEWFCRVVEEFSSYGHSGGSASICIPMLQKLLWFENLTPLTDNPDEWQDVSGYTSDGRQFWQNKRNGSAFSEDGGKTYTLLEERIDRTWRNLWLKTTPVHKSVRAKD